MKYLYFTKPLQSLDVPGLIQYCKDAGLDGVDLAVRPDYPIHPANVKASLPDAAKRFRDAGLVIGIATTATTLNDPASADMQAIFEACAAASVPFVKIGYFRYAGKFDADLAQARARVAGFAKLAARTGVRCCCHTHSGLYVGNNAASMRALVADTDPHQIGVYLDTGHVTVNGGPIRQEIEMLRQWLTLVAIKDMLWEKGAKGWAHKIVPANDGIVQWPEVVKGLAGLNYDGFISLHGEYPARDMTERMALAKRELAFLKTLFRG